MGSKKDRTEYSDAALGQVVVEGLDDPDMVHDEVFGTITDQGPNYRNVRTSTPYNMVVLILKKQLRSVGLDPPLS